MSIPSQPLLQSAKYSIFAVFSKDAIFSHVVSGPIVYRLGHGLFKAGSGVRLPVGSKFPKEIDDFKTQKYLRFERVESRSATARGGVAEFFSRKISVTDSP